MESSPSPALHGQRYSLSPTPESLFDASPQRGALRRRRQREKRKTGGRAPSAPASRYKSPLSLSPDMASAIPAPAIPPQLLGAGFERAGAGHDHGLHLHRVSDSINPIYLNSLFRQYREKQEQKTADDPRQKWPRVLEDAFLDALLLVPNMGRQKYSMRGGLHGRNMLILEYIWIAYCMSLGPGELPDPAYRRGRKQVSSHIQVLKNFYKYAKYYHVLFGSEESENQKETRRSRKRRDSTDEDNSVKDSDVLHAIADGRLPDQRPNYDYFTGLLTADSRVALRPSAAWLYVSSTQMRLDKETGTFYDRDGNAVDDTEFPHLGWRESSPDGPGRDKDDGTPRPQNGVLVHEYARSLAQREFASGTAREVARDWATDFPGLHAALERCTAADEGCDMLELTVTAELCAAFPFPAGAHLNAVVELEVQQQQQAELCTAATRWKCITRLLRPRELCADAADAELLEQVREMDSAEDRRERRERGILRVPFPAAEWASILARCSSYADYPGQRRVRRSRGGSARVVEDEGVTSSELLDQVAMLQEIWSSAPDDMGGGGGNWTRRCVLVWRFQSMYPSDRDGQPLFSAKNGERVVNPPGTAWRFLTALDPTSPAHHRMACVDDDGSFGRTNDHDVSAMVSPGLSGHQLVGPSTPVGQTYDFGWHADERFSQHQQHPPALSSGASSLDHIYPFSGLATPPSIVHHHSAFAESYFAHAFDPQQQQQHLVGVGSSSSSDTPIDPFLTGHGAALPMSDGMFHDGGGYPDGLPLRDYGWHLFGDPLLLPATGPTAVGFDAHFSWGYDELDSPSQVLGLPEESLPLASWFSGELKRERSVSLEVESVSDMPARKKARRQSGIHR